jgi:hypothetical protein
MLLLVPAGARAGDVPFAISASIYGATGPSRAINGVPVTIEDRCEAYKGP